MKVYAIRSDENLWLIIHGVHDGEHRWTREFAADCLTSNLSLVKAIQKNQSYQNSKIVTFSLVEEK